MIKLEYQVKFTTPAFLGNAEQDGQWRTPPFKALLRQWWRVAFAAGRHDDPALVADMRRHEGELFGVAADGEGDSRKSQIRIRLSRWDLGRQKTWQTLHPVAHPEVRFPVDSGLYLGYGPVTLPRGASQPKLKGNAAVQAGESATLSLGGSGHLCAAHPERTLANGPLRYPGRTQSQRVGILHPGSWCRRAPCLGRRP